MSFILLGILNSQVSGLAQAFFINIIGGAGEDRANSVVAESSDSIYVAGFTKSVGAGESDALLIQLDAEGNVIWQKKAGAAKADTLIDINIDSGGNVYTAGGQEPSGASVRQWIVKWDSAGAIVWQTSINQTSGGIQARAIDIDSSGNVYAGGNVSESTAGAGDGILVKLNSTGGVVFQKILGRSSNDSFVGVHTAGSNIYASGITKDPSPFVDFIFLVKYDDTGSVVWERQLGNNAADSAGGRVAIDSSGNVYVVGRTNVVAQGGVLAKYDSSGTLIYQRKLATSFFFDISIDENDEIYISGLVTGGGGGLIVKYDDAGNVVFQRTISNMSNLSGISTTSNAMVVAGHSTFDSNDVATFRLPKDGTLTGTYTIDGQTIVYAAGSLTASTPTLTSSAPSSTAATKSYNVTTPTLTPSDAGLATETLII